VKRGMALRDYEDYMLLAAALLAALADALQANPKYVTWALIIGALAKALMSIVSRGKDSDGILYIEETHTLTTREDEKKEGG
jgi:uncharacterized membrane protein